MKLLKVYSLQGELVFYINGVSYGAAVENIPSNVFAVVDLYGKVAQVTITSCARHGNNFIFIKLSIYSFVACNSNYS